ncbi:hypothetical protein DENSPDRAFT_834827 [Dentipellis sp. KUC8613]|nr:hypothetical protein DENSPDRAFT_834827 [Dentipellis sp. KUC8613]
MYRAPYVHAMDDSEYTGTVSDVILLPATRDAIRSFLYVTSKHVSPANHTARPLFSPRRISLQQSDILAISSSTHTF